MPTITWNQSSGYMRIMSSLEVKTSPILIVFHLKLA